MGIVEFLEARIAEDEARADAIHSLAAERYGGVPVYRNVSGSPARILREVAAKRAIIVEHKLVPAKNVWGNSTGGFGCELCDSTPDLDLGGIEIERSNGCKTLRTLAVIFSDHPDFSEGWRP